MNLVYVHHLSPFIVQTQLFGHMVGLRWYGLAYVLGFALALAFLSRAALRQTVPGFDTNALQTLMTFIVVGVLLGGRLGFVVQHPHEVMSDPLFVLRVWQGGMAFFGGLAGVLLAVAWTVRRHHLAFWALTDLLTLPAALGLGIGRIANFVNGELVGKPTGANWGVVFPRVDYLPRHPSQLYEAATHFLMFGFLVLVARRYPQWLRERTGRLSFLFLALYGLLRFVTDFYRADDSAFGPFSVGQWASLLLGIAGLWLLWRTKISCQNLKIEELDLSHQPDRETTFLHL